VKEVRASKLQRSLMAALTKAESEVEDAGMRVRDLSMQTVKRDGLVAETPSGRIDTTYLDGLRLKKMELQSHLIVQKQRLAQAQDALLQAVEADKQDLKRDAAKGTGADQRLDADGFVVAARNQLKRAKGHLENLEATLNADSNSPNAIEVEKEMEALEGQLERLVELRRRDGTHRDLQPSRSDLFKQVQSMESLVADVEAQISAIEDSIGRYLIALKQPFASPLDMQFAEADLESWRAIRKVLHERRMQWKIEREAVDDITELERASPPDEPESSHLYRKIAAVSASCFCIPFVLLPAIYGVIYLRRSADGVSTPPQL